jgi:F-type H+-transporting ATPase subunit delta
MAKLEREPANHETVLDVTEEQVARVYAKAFLEVAAKAPNTAELVDEVVSLVNDVLNRVPRLEELLRSALVSQEEKEQFIERVFGKRASLPVVHFLKVISRHGRLELLRPIARVLRKLHAERSGLTEVEVRVATELSDAVRQEIQQRLQRALGTQPVLNVAIDPALIAGVWVRVGDRVFDGSIRTQLEHARRHMIERATERIETAPERFVVAGAG